MKILILGTVVVEGTKSETDSEIVRRSIPVQAIVSFPALPRVGDEIDFEDQNGVYSTVITTATVNKVRWQCEEDKQGVVFPIVELKDEKFGSTMHALPGKTNGETIDWKYQSYIEDLNDHEVPFGTVFWRQK